VTPWQIMQTLRYKGTRDPFFANVRFLLHFDDPANPQIFPDVIGNTWVHQTPGSDITNLQVSNTQAAVSSAGSLRVKSAGGTSSDYTLSASPPIGGNYSMGAGNLFTLEGWIWWTGDINSRLGLASVYNSISSEIIAIKFNTTNQFRFFTAFGSNHDGFVNPPLNQWVHLAMTYDGTTKYWFVNGVLQGSVVTGAGATQTIATYLMQSIASGGNPPYAYTDDVRFTVGVCRYTSNFSVPTAPYPNS
jgi:hypothetical protein